MKDREASKAEELKRRTKAFAVRIIGLFRSLPQVYDARVIGRQVMRSGTSIGANYRAACRARSRAEFTAKIGIVLEEADETVYWLELPEETAIVRKGDLAAILKEANELLAIFAASYRTARHGTQQSAMDQF